MNANVYVYIFCWTKSTIKNDAENGQYAVKRRGYILTKIMSPTFHATLWVVFLIWIFSMFWNSPSQASRRWPKTRTCLVSGLGMLFQLDHLWTTGSTFSSHAASESGSDIWWHPHHLGQHQTHHFRQHPEITHSSHFGCSLWATRISSLWATRKTSFLSSHYLIQPFRVWLGGWGGTKTSLMLGTRVGSMDLNHHLTQPFRVWLEGVGGDKSAIDAGNKGGIHGLKSSLDSAI